LNPDNVHDSAGKEDQICEPCREQRLKVSVVAKHLTRFHEDQVDETDRHRYSELYR